MKHLDGRQVGWVAACRTGGVDFSPEDIQYTREETHMEPEHGPLEDQKFLHEPSGFPCNSLPERILSGTGFASGQHKQDCSMEDGFGVRLVALVRSW